MPVQARRGPGRPRQTAPDHGDPAAKASRAGRPRRRSRIVATDTRADGAGRTLDYRHLPRVTFTTPAIAAAGLTQARPRGAWPVTVASCPCVRSRGPGQPRPDEARRRARHRTGARSRTSSPRAQGRLTTAPSTNHPAASSAETYRIRPTPSCRPMERGPVSTPDPGPPGRGLVARCGRCGSGHEG